MSLLGGATNLYFGPGTQNPGGTAPPAWAVGGTTAPAGTSTPISAPSDSQQSAKALVQSILNKAGLEALGDWAWNRVLALGGGQGAIDQMLLELPDQQAYKDRFPYMAPLAAKGRAISEAQAIDLERTMYQLGHQYGLTDSVLTKGLVNGMIEGETSPAEFEQRLKIGQLASSNAVPEVAQELNRLYGINRGDITSLVLDPKNSTQDLLRKMQAAQDAAAASLSGYGQLTVAEAERLSQLGIDFTQAQQGFGHLFHERELFTPLPGEQGQPAIGQDQQLAAEFGGDAAAQEAIQRKAGARLAPFRGGGSFAETSKGVAGLGSVNS